jgi:flagellar hook protein FlgE
MAFSQAVSGLNVAATGLDIIGANIANASTVGFKNSRGDFSDIFASYLNATPGNGAATGSVSQKFTQGSIITSGNALDFSINGNGMFQVASDPTATDRVAYTRNGEFRSEPVPTAAGVLPSERYIVNATGNYLMGWQAGAPTTGATSVLRIADAVTGLQTTESRQQVNLDDASPAIIGVPFDPAVAGSFTWSNSQTIYTGTGNDMTPRALTTYFVKTDTPNTWNVYTRLDGVAPAEEAAGPRQMVFSGAGLLLSPGQLTNSFPDGAVTVDLSNSTQFAAASDALFSSQNGYDDGGLASISLDPGGQILGRYSNGQTLALGTVALATFVNNNGLQSIGDNLWLETANSGVANIGTAATGGRGVLGSYSLEQSNVDLAAELVDMIVMQRNYQANAQMVKTQDEVLRSLVALR